MQMKEKQREIWVDRKVFDETSMGVKVRDGEGCRIGRRTRRGSVEGTDDIL